MGLNIFSESSLGLMGTAIGYWLICFLFMGFFAQSAYFESNVVTSSQLSSYYSWIDALSDNSFSLDDVTAFTSVAVLGFSNLPWYLNVVCNAVPAILFLLGLIGYIRGI